MPMISMFFLGVKVPQAVGDVCEIATLCDMPGMAHGNLGVMNDAEADMCWHFLVVVAIGVGPQLGALGKSAFTAGWAGNERSIARIGKYPVGRACENNVISFLGLVFDIP
jgi:hypothetical protein